jgi:hypothetical protein
VVYPTTVGAFTMGIVPVNSNCRPSDEIFVDVCLAARSSDTMTQVFKDKAMSSMATERVQAHAYRYELAFLSTDKIFHSQLCKLQVSNPKRPGRLVAGGLQVSTCQVLKLADFIDVQMCPSCIMPSDISQTRAENT